MLKHIKHMVHDYVKIQLWSKGQQSSYRRNGQEGLVSTLRHKWIVIQVQLDQNQGLIISCYYNIVSKIQRLFFSLFSHRFLMGGSDIANDVT